MRSEALKRLEGESDVLDVLIIGGGATGLGIAVDAATRGYRTALVEAGDFAQATSSRATKLVHGGVRYLASGQIHLVYEALHERAVMLRNAPHLVQPLPFALPAMADRADGVLAAGRAAAGLAARVQAAVLALIRAADPADCVSAEMPGILAVDAAALCMEDPDGLMQGVRRLPPGKVAALLGGRDVVFRDAPADSVLLHAEAAALARHDALIRVPGSGPAAIVALVTRDSRTLDPGQGAGALAFLGRAVAAALGR